MIRFLIYGFLGLVGFMPALMNLRFVGQVGIYDWLFSGLYLFSFITVIYFLFDKNRLSLILRDIARNLGIRQGGKSIIEMLREIRIEVRRKNDSLAIGLIEKKISNKDELTDTLEELVSLSYRLLDASSVELALFDAESGLYHSALVMGFPRNKGSQAMLSGAAEGNEEEVISEDLLVQPIRFSGSDLGTIRVELKPGTPITDGDRQFMHLLAQQSGLAILNCQYTERLMKMRMSSEESIKAKTGFLATLSHEIRGPLGVMMNAVELVLDGLCGEVSEEQVETLSMIKTNGAHLLELVNDVLDYAKVESGKITPKPETLETNDLLLDITKVVKAQAESKKHKLIFQSSELPLAFKCDRRHSRQILINLLTNAIKYTPDTGRIEVWAEKSGNKIKLNVRDNGIGISKEDHPKVFAAFERIENNYSLKQIGTGLGMSLTKSLVHANGGTIGFDSDVGQGSHFWVMFEAAEIEAVVQATEVEQEDNARGTGEIILLIESEEGERRMLSRYLEHIGFSVVSAANKDEALSAIRDKEVRLAIIDNKIFAGADVSEEEMIKTIRDSCPAVRLPIVLVSGRAFVFDIERALKAGADLCLTKPIALRKLASTARKLIDGAYTSTNVEESTILEDETVKKITVNPKLGQGLVH